MARIYDTALDLTCWSDLVHDLRTHLDAHSATFTIFDRRCGGISRIDCTLYDEGMVRAYQQYFHRVDPWARLGQEASVGELLISHEHVPDPELERSEFYSDFLKPHGDVMYSVGVPLLRADDIAVHIAVQRTRSQGPLAPAQTAEFGRLADHMLRAVRIGHALLRVDERRHVLAGAFDALGIAVLVADGQARLLYASREAERLMTRHPGLSVRQGRLHAATPLGTDALRRQIHAAAEAAGGRAGAPPDGITLGDPGGGQAPLWAVVLPLAAHHLAEGVPPRPTAAVFLTAPDGRRPPPARLLMTFFGLTATEARLASALSEGQTLESYAEARGVRLPTARSHLASVFHKTGTSRQTELVRLVLSLTAGPSL